MKFKIKKHKTMGRGLFATEDIKKGETIEVSPVVVLDPKSTERLDRTFLMSYVFHWSRGRSAIGLGYGSLFNHSDTDANVDWKPDEKKNVIRYKTSRSIKKGEQLLINYGYDPTSFVWKKGKWIWR